MWRTENQEVAKAATALVAAHKALKKAQEQWERAREAFLALQVGEVVGDGVKISVVDRDVVAWKEVVNKVKEIIEQTICTSDLSLLQQALELISHPPSSTTKVVNIRFSN